MSKHEQNAAAQKPPTKRELKLQARYEEIVKLRHLKRMKIQEIAAHLGISERLIYRRMAEPGYQQAVDRLRTEWKESTRTGVYELGSEVLATLRELMGPETKSEHVRFEAAAKLGDWLGLGEQVAEQNTVDDTSELQRLFTILEERTRPRDIPPPPKPGGFLPTATVTEIGEFIENLKAEHVAGEVMEEA